MEIIQFGNRAKDLVSGFEGVVTGEVRYMNGCEKWAIDGTFKADGTLEGHWFDKQQVVKVNDGITAEIKKPKEGGGPMRTPPRG